MINPPAKVIYEKKERIDCFELSLCRNDTLFERGGGGATYNLDWLPNLLLDKRTNLSLRLVKKRKNMKTSRREAPRFKPGTAELQGRRAATESLRCTWVDRIR